MLIKGGGSEVDSLRPDWDRENYEMEQTDQRIQRAMAQHARSSAAAERKATAAAAAGIGT